MKCDLCEGEYQEKRVTRSYKRDGRTLVIEDVPALVCYRCGDTLLTEDTVKRIQEILDENKEPQAFAPVFTFTPRAA